MSFILSVSSRPPLQSDLTGKDSNKHKNNDKDKDKSKDKKTDDGDETDSNRFPNLNEYGPVGFFSLVFPLWW